MGYQKRTVIAATAVLAVMSLQHNSAMAQQRDYFNVELCGAEYSVLAESCNAGQKLPIPNGWEIVPQSDARAPWVITQLPPLLAEVAILSDGYVLWKPRLLKDLVNCRYLNCAERVIDVSCVAQSWLV